MTTRREVTGAAPSAAAPPRRSGTSRHPGDQGCPAVRGPADRSVARSGQSLPARPAPPGRAPGQSAARSPADTNAGRRRPSADAAGRLAGKTIGFEVGPQCFAFCEGRREAATSGSETCRRFAGREHKSTRRLVNGVAEWGVPEIPADPKNGAWLGARQRRRSRVFGPPVVWVSGQAAWGLCGWPGLESGSGMRQRVTSKPRAASLPVWWAIWRRVLAWRS
jgi:hypothetical protein